MAQDPDRLQDPEPMMRLRAQAEEARRLKAQAKGSEDWWRMIGTMDRLLLAIEAREARLGYERNKVWQWDSPHLFMLAVGIGVAIAAAGGLLGALIGGVWHV
jgi:hypothetical protein